MEPILGMRFHHPEQLKVCLAIYGVTNGYPLWFCRNDWRKLLVYYGRDVESVSTRSRSKSGEGTSKSPKTPVKAVNSGEACSESPKWTKSKCKRAKQRALFDYEGGLKEHYRRLWEYRKAILDSNLGSTCRLDDEETEFGNYYFRRFYVCFKGVKDGWLTGCRKVIGLDGCFLKHTCRGELLVAMGRDANNQMYPIAWAVIKVENNENWCWFISLIQEDLQLETGEGLTIISDSDKGLLEGVNELLPNAEHRKCTRHLFANYKKKFSGVQLQCLFWNATSTTVEQLYYSKMEELKIISIEAYQYLCDRNPNSWCRAFFRQESKCPNFKNGICEIARTWEHSITPSIRKRVEVLKEKQRDWMVIPSGFQVLESGKKDDITNCQETGHNKSSCKKPPVPKPKINRPSVSKPHEYGTYASVRGRGRGSRGGRSSFGGRGKGTATIGDTGRSQRGRGMGQRGRGRGQRGRGRGQMQRNGEQMKEDEIRKNLEHEYMEEMLLQEKQKIDAYQAQQDEFDQDALRCTMEEEARFKRQDEERLKEQLVEQEWESKMDYYHPSNWSQKEESFKVGPYNRHLTTVDANVQTQESVAANISDRGEIGFRLGDFEAEIPSEEPIAAVTPSADKGKQLAEPSEQPELQLRRSKRKAPTSSKEALTKQRITFHKNRGRSERIFNQKMKKSGFGKDGEGSTPEKAFSLI
ncbi:chloramphenicol acetyltransferase-like domain-containing protein [Tanacetum coccineum]|uniref:Chloramphenicol acetyltransferase-like domain-containing protein n=1 Tax=Tanacetum coccineum TaxID=301880 RepID=A0ABQ5G5Z7_9ASTR